MDSRSATPSADLLRLAFQREQAGDIAGALRLARRALDQARSEGHALAGARALAGVARYRFRLGQYDAARQLAAEALAATDPADETQAAVHAEALLLLGMCASETHALGECEDYYRRAADLAREIGDDVLFQRALHNLGSAVYLMRGQFALAIAADTQALRICHENGLADWAQFPLITLAIAYQLTGQAALAHESLAELRALARPGSGGEGYAAYVEAMLALDDGEIEAAQAHLARARAVAEALGDPSLNLDVRLGLSRACRLCGRAADAHSWAADAVALADRLGYRIYQGRARLERGRAAWLNGDTSAAEDDLAAAGEICDEMTLRCDLAEALLLRAALAHALDNPQAGPLLCRAAAAVQAGGFAFLLERERALAYPLVAAHLGSAEADPARAAAMLLERLQQVPPPPLAVRTLGGLAVHVGRRPVEPRALRQRRAGELLALLLASPGYSLSSAQVAEAMCPDKTPQAALDFYHHGISALRRLLEPDLPDRRFSCRYLAASDERVTLLLPPGSTLDVDELERCVRRADWAGAVALCAGEYLPELRYVEWTLPARQHWADLAEQARLALARERLAGGQAATCLALARQVLLHNAWQEQAAELGMRAALELGDRGTALRIYQRLAQVLERELGIEPQPELRQLHATLKRRPCRD